MKIITANGFALLAAVATFAATANNSLAQDLAPGEYIVGPEQVLSDTVVGPQYDMQADPVSSDGYAGDMSCDEAGCSSGEAGCSCGKAGCALGAIKGRLAGLLHGCGTSVGDIGNIERGYGRPDLFYNYYTSGQANKVNAQMYLSPLPVPPNVGHTFFTYQPFYPEEMLYWHKNKFHNNYDNGRGMNRTRAVYFAPPIRQAASNLYWNKLRLPR